MPQGGGLNHYSDVMMGGMASQVTSLTIVYSTVYSGTDQRKHQSSASLAFAQGIHRWPVNSPHKWPVTRKMFPFDDVIMTQCGQVTPCILPTIVWEIIDSYHRTITWINGNLSSIVPCGIQPMALSREGFKMQQLILKNTPKKLQQHLPG